MDGAIAHLGEVCQARSEDDRRVDGQQEVGEVNGKTEKVGDHLMKKSMVGEVNKVSLDFLLGTSFFAAGSLMN